MSRMDEKAASATARHGVGQVEWSPGDHAAVSILDTVS